MAGTLRFARPTKLSQPRHQLRRRIAVRRQSELDLFGLYGCARLQPEEAVDLADIVAAAREQLLQFPNLSRRKRHDLLAAAMHGGRARDAGREIGRAGRIDDRLVPLEEDLEVRIGEKRRPEPTHWEQQ